MSGPTQAALDDYEQRNAQWMDRIRGQRPEPLDPDMSQELRAFIDDMPLELKP